MKNEHLRVAACLAFLAGLPGVAGATGAGGDGGGGDGTEWCNGVDDDGDGLVDEGYDQDGDGWVICRIGDRPADCQPDDADVYPGAPEVCDGKDNDCDWLVDEGFDQDGDGVTTCAGDCDDADNTIKPGAQELCNHVDDDCDGAVDEGLSCEPLMLDGFVYEDADCDGIRGDNDRGLPGYLVVAVGPDCDGDGHRDTVSDFTDEIGIYWIMPTCPGTWKVGVVVGQGQSPTTENPVDIPVPEVQLLDFGVDVEGICDGGGECPPVPVCGNGVVEPGEACDDGNNVDGDGCQSDCELPRCGDGVVDPGEECDDGNNICSDECRECRIAICGDGDLDFGEACDDGNNVSGDGCQADCELPRCGDGILDPAEQCDDGNQMAGDGCGPLCMLEVECALDLDLTVTPEEIQGGPVPSCETIDGKPLELTFRYTGGGCAASQNTQDDGKTSCEGSVDGGAAVMVDAAGGGNADKPYTVDPGQVAPGGEFTIAKPDDDLESDSWIFLSNAGGEEAIKLHTSCSQPLQVGDVFGSVTLVGINGQRAPASDVAWTYEVTNNGSAVDDVVLEDDQFGVIAEGFSLAPGESRVFVVDDVVDGDATHNAAVSGFLANGQVCAAEDSASVDVLPPPDTCEDGKPQVLEMEYTAEGCAGTDHDQDPSKVECTGGAMAQTVRVVVNDDQNPGDRNELFFEGEVSAGETFAIDARTAGRDDLKSDTYIHVFDDAGNVIETVKFHTSCSQPLNVGDQFGSFLVTGFVARP